MEPEGTMIYSPGLFNDPYLETKMTNHLINTYFFGFIIIESSHLRLDLSKYIFLVGLLVKIWKHSYLIPLWLHDLPI